MKDVANVAMTGGMRRYPIPIPLMTPTAMATAKTAASAYAPDQGSALFMTVLSTHVNRERAVPDDKSIPPARMTAACPIVIRMRGANALMFRTMDLVSKKFCWRIAVRENMMTRMRSVENSGLET